MSQPPGVMHSMYVQKNAELIAPICVGLRQKPAMISSSATGMLTRLNQLMKLNDMSKSTTRHRTQVGLAVAGTPEPIAEDGPVMKCSAGVAETARRAHRPGRAGRRHSRR